MLTPRILLLCFALAFASGAAGVVGAWVLRRRTMLRLQNLYAPAVVGIVLLVIDRFSVHDRGCSIEPDVEAGRAVRADRDVLQVVTQPAADLVPELPGPLGETAEHVGAVKLAGQLGKLLALRNTPLAGRDRAITVAYRDHADLVRASHRADLSPPLLRIHTLRRTHLTTAQQLGIITAGSFEIVLGDPSKPLDVLRRHAESR